MLLLVARHMEFASYGEKSEPKSHRNVGYYSCVFGGIVVDEEIDGAEKYLACCGGLNLSVEDMIFYDYG